MRLNITPASSGSSPPSAITWVEIELDFGTKAVYEKNFVVVDAGSSVSSTIIINESGKVATDRAAGDSQWDSVSVTALPANGSFTVYAIANPGPIVGKRKFNYSVM